MMNDDAYEKLNDYVDGLLPEDERRAFEALLAADAELQAEAESLRAIRAQASVLPRELEPSRDLWQGVAARIGADERNVISFHRSRRSLSPAWLAYAAAAAVVFALAYLGLPRVVSGPTSSKKMEEFIARTQETATQMDEASTTDAELQRVTAQYLEARAQLVALLEERKSDIAPETYAVVEENLSVIAAAVGEIEVALAAEPESPKLERLLYAAYQSEVDLLQQAVKLADTRAETAGEADGTEGENDAV